MTKHRTDAAATLLADVRADRVAEHAAAARILARAAEWADLHPPVEGGYTASATVRGRPTGAPLAGEGTPEVDEGCIAELAAALRCSTDAGTNLIGHALELRHRLPRLWALVHAGNVAPWQARHVADRTMVLTPEAAGFVDAQIAAVTGKIGLTQLDRLITTAIARFMPAEAERRRLEAQDQRCFDIHPDLDGHRHGLADVVGRLDLPDALDLEAAIASGARMLAEAGVEKSLDVRRSMAAGELARSQPALDLTTANTYAPDDDLCDASIDSADVGGAAAYDARKPRRQGACDQTLHPDGASNRAQHHGTEGMNGPASWSPRTPSQVTLYVHIDADSLTNPDGLPGWVGNAGIPVTAQQIRDWCGRPDTKITIRPVIDLNQTLTVDGYQVPDRIREHIALRDRTCVFPWCSRPAHPRSLRQPADGTSAWSTDADHTIPYEAGGETSTDNLAPLCRKHHRLKTHTRWRYRTFALGHYEWTSPNGLRFRRGPDGATIDTTPPDARPPAGTPPDLRVVEPGPPASRRRAATASARGSAPPPRRASRVAVVVGVGVGVGVAEPPPPF